MSQPLVQARSLGVTFGGGPFGGPGIRAVQSVDLSIAAGEAVGLVGESGSGKSTIGRALLGLQPASTGSVRFDGVELRTAGRAALAALRPRVQMVFQDPHSSLDPRRPVGEQIVDGLAIHGLANAAERRARAGELLTQVGLDISAIDRLPGQFSGGQKQRIGIARALATRPDFLVADEPVSALDVSVQAQIVALLDDLRRRLGIAILFISHDLAVVRQLCERAVVLYLGRIVEQGPIADVFDRPRHPYTQALLSAVPTLENTGRRAIMLKGEPPSPSNPPSGCAVRTRCPYALPACAAGIPRLTGGIHAAACIRTDLPPFQPEQEASYVH